MFGLKNFVVDMYDVCAWSSYVNATQAPVPITALCHNFVFLLNYDVRMSLNRILDNLLIFLLA